VRAFEDVPLYFDWVKNLTNFGNAVGVVFEALFGLEYDAAAEAKVGLWNLSTDDEVASVSHTGSSNNFQLKSVAVPANHFDDGDRMGVKSYCYKTGASSGACYLHKAWLKIVVTNLSKAESYIRLGRYYQGSHGATEFLTWGRTLWKQWHFLDPQCYLEATAFWDTAATGYLGVQDVGASDAGDVSEAGTVNTASKILASSFLENALKTVRGGEFTLVHGNRLGAVVNEDEIGLGAVFLVVVSSGFGGFQADLWMAFNF